MPEGTDIIKIEDEKAMCTKNILNENPARIPHRWSNKQFGIQGSRGKSAKPKEETKLL